MQFAVKQSQHDDQRVASVAFALLFDGMEWCDCQLSGSLETLVRTSSGTVWARTETTVDMTPSAMAKVTRKV